MKNIILIYDDDEEILLLCKAILSKFGLVVETLSRCENILNDIKSIQPHLILMDLWIPEIGGEKAITIAKQNDTTCNVPILLFSANADIEQITKKVNADGYIKKPFAINTLIDTINKHIIQNDFSNTAS